MLMGGVEHLEESGGEPPVGEAREGNGKKQSGF
jgi:hypothetical protein